MKTTQDIQEIVDLVDYKEGFDFIVTDTYIQLREFTTCNYSGKPYESKGRKWKWSPHMTKSEVVTTCLKACLQYEEHEAREAFKYKNLSIFDPHYDIDLLHELRSREDFSDLRADH